MMLSTASRPYIDASVPVLREHGQAITRRFYESMFTAHPELRNLFNMGNQASGAQQGALAAALVAYAANIDRQDALAPVVERIVHKHVSVGIESAHYPIVGRHLLGAIQQVLGEAAVPPLMAAWDEAYWLLAGALIAAEARLYERSGTAPGQFEPLRVSAVTRESDDVVSYRLQTSDGRSPGSFVPGQYVSVAVTLPDGLRQIRQYSLSDAPSRGAWRISVKREDESVGHPSGRVSNHLHAHVQVGDTLHVGAAFGNFKPAHVEGRPLALISAGVGITPMMSVLHALADAGDTRPILFAHAAYDAAHHPFRPELLAARERLPQLAHHVWYEVPHPSDGASHDDHVRTGRMSLTSSLLGPFVEADFYLCGSLGFMRAQWESLVGLGISPLRMQREVFGPELLDHLS